MKWRWRPADPERRLAPIRERRDHRRRSMTGPAARCPPSMRSSYAFEDDGFRRASTRSRGGRACCRRSW